MSNRKIKMSKAELNILKEAHLNAESDDVAEKYSSLFLLGLEVGMRASEGSEWWSTLDADKEYIKQFDGE